MKSVVILLPVLMLMGTAYYLTRPSLSQEQLLVQTINSQNLGWTATEYPDLPRSLGLLNGSQLLNEKLGLTYKSFAPEELLSAPDSFDSRERWPNCESIKDIRNQGKCGSCWAFATATTLSDRLCIGSGQKIQTRLSPEDVLSCCFSCGNGCDGGFQGAAWDFFMQTGIVSGNGYGDTKYCKSYSIAPSNTNPVTPPCKRYCTTNPNIGYFNNRTKASSGYLLIGEDKFKAEISTNGPIVATLTVYEDFTQYKSGVYWHKTGGVLGGHVVRIIGYGEENGVKYWTAANSWTNIWGDNGYFRIRRGNNECGIEAEGLAGIVKHA